MHMVQKIIVSTPLIALSNVPFQWADDFTSFTHFTNVFRTCDIEIVPETFLERFQNILNIVCSQD